MPRRINHAGRERNATPLRLRPKMGEQLEGELERRMPLPDQAIHRPSLRTLAVRSAARVEKALRGRRRA